MALLFQEGKVIGSQPSPNIGDVLDFHNCFGKVLGYDDPVSTSEISQEIRLWVQDLNNFSLFEAVLVNTYLGMGEWRMRVRR
jgi:hypothetical protein